MSSPSNRNGKAHVSKPKTHSFKLGDRVHFLGSAIVSPCDCVVVARAQGNGEASRTHVQADGFSFWPLTSSLVRRPKSKATKVRVD